MALRDNRIAAESVGVNVTKYKLMAFVTSAALAGALSAAPFRLGRMRPARALSWSLLVASITRMSTTAYTSIR